MRLHLYIVIIGACIVSSSAFECLQCDSFANPDCNDGELQALHQRDCQVTHTNLAQDYRCMKRRFIYPEEGRGNNPEIRIVRGCDIKRPDGDDEDVCEEGEMILQGMKNPVPLTTCYCHDEGCNSGNTHKVSVLFLTIYPFALFQYF